MVLNLIMLRITSVLSTLDKPVVCVPERSWIHAATYGTKPYLPDGLVHHMLARASNGAAGKSYYFRIALDFMRNVDVEYDRGHSQSCHYVHRTYEDGYRRRRTHLRGQNPRRFPARG